MLDAIKSALNRIRPASHKPAATPKTPRQDTLAQDGVEPRTPRKRAPYDPLKPHAAASPRAPKHRASPTPAVAAKTTADATKTINPARMSLAHRLLDVMRVGDFVMLMLMEASCPPDVADDEGVQQLVLDAIGVRFELWQQANRHAFRSLMDEAARDLCREFAGPALQKLQDFAATQAGAMLLGELPQLLLKLKYGELGPEDPKALQSPEGRALAAMLDQVHPGVSSRMRRLPREILDGVAGEILTPDVVEAIAWFLKGPTGRAFAAYVQRACWLGIPNALVVQRHTWVRSVQSEMVTMLQLGGVMVPPPWSNIPIYEPSVVKIEEVAA